MLTAYEVTRPEPLPRIRLELDSSVGDDALMVSDALGAKLLVCTPATELCRLEVAPGTRLRIDAIPGPTSTFLGWEGCSHDDDEDVLRFDVVVDHEIDLTVRFGKQPEEVMVSMVETPTPPDLVLPQLPRPTPPKPPKTLEEIEAEKLEEPPLEVAVVPPLPPDFVPPPLPPPVPPPPPPTPKDQPPPPPPEMRMVEVPDENEVKEAPDDATHLSDKNRDVTEETAAKETNLEKESKGEVVASAPSEDTSEEIGGPDDEIHQLEDSEPTTTERVEATEHSGTEETAKGAVTGDGGDDGEDGKGEQKEPGVLAMRGIEGRGSVTDQQDGDGKKKGKKGAPGVKTQLDFDDYERIVGQDRAEKEREVAARTRSTKKGRYKKKLEAVKSALENFTPDIRTGNQTALKTRAHPFAVFVARMHRRIHEMWGFGFLEDMDRKSSDHKLNDFDLFASIEVAINPDGTVYKATIAKTSGMLEYDVAALDTILSSAPYESTPEAIRSVDQRVYLRWGFYRNWRQCGTFNVEPYILTDIPGGIVALDEGMDTSSKPITDDDTVTPEPAEGSGADGVHEGHEHGDDKTATGSTEAKYAANMWIAGFSTGSVDRMLKVSAVPFYGGAEIAAETTKDLRDVYEGLIVESGALKTWELLTAEDYAAKVGSQIQLSDGALVLAVRAKETFAVVLVPTKSGEYRANAVLR